MRLRLATCLAVFLAAALSPAARAVEQVRQLGVYVPPYYAAGTTTVEPPKVAVDPAFDKLLASRNAADIRKVRDAIAANADLVKPTTMMVLAIRLYDVGLRDDAVFWFYAARDRYATVEAVFDMRSLALANTALAVDNFVGAVGPAINSYAFCDVARQQAQEDQAIEWVARHPYHLLESQELPSAVDDRNAALGETLARLRAAADKSKALLAQPGNLAEMKDLRAHNQADARFCWK